MKRQLRVLSVGTDAKTVKGEKYGYLTGILYLSPADEIPGHNLCPNASPGCRAACLYTAGRGRMQDVMGAREKKTLRFLKNREAFIEDLRKDIADIERLARDKEMRPVVRLNGTSDLPWEKIAPSLFSEFPSVQFMDYTKIPLRMRNFLNGKFPANYHLTFSRSETNHRRSMEILRLGGQVAVVFSGKVLPIQWKGFPVWDGDKHDARFSDRAGVIGLVAKGDARKDTSGFVVSA